MNKELIGMNSKELEEFVTDLKQPKFRAEQIFNWLYNKKVDTIDKMSNLSKGLRAELKEKANLERLKVITSQKSKDGTIKYLFELADGHRIESVYLPEGSRKSVCLSTQVGCGMGCTFCATGLQGLSRDLTAGEIINQILTIEDITGQRITNIVLMGMGEPLANYDNTLKAIDLMNDSAGINIGMRKITLSTCGLVPQIKKLAEEELQLTLAISLHASINTIRSEIMPINKKYRLKELISACRYYIDKTSRRVTFEYALINGKNDSLQDAKRLASLLSGILAHVNLIPLNQVEGLDLNSSQKKSIRLFKEKLDSEGISVTIRKERGGDIAAACGQLQAIKED